MKLYNSYTQQVEELTPIVEGQVNMYVCGPTVYNYPHIGNARPIVVFDTLKKALRVQDYVVRYVSNYTDVDDKIIQQAMKENTTEKEITDRYIQAYNDTRLDLHADMPDVTPRVTETMPQVIAFIERLIEEGAAYQVDGDVYFRVEKDPHYGHLSHQKIEDLMVGARIDENNKKENPLDFTLWKETSEGIQWDSPWSKGRPGWHTECVVMIQDVFQMPLIDIHGGGMDLKFPHHENEIAQCECVNHTRLANIWVHNGMINIDKVKMSKSLGNVWWAKDLIEKYNGNVVRWVLISTQYRAPLNLSEETFNTAIKELSRIETAHKQANVTLALNDAQVIYETEPTLWNQFLDAMNDDLNTPNAISVVFECIKQMNQVLRVRNLDLELIGKLVYTLEQMLYVLGISLDAVFVTVQDKELYAQWKQAVAEKNFEEADKMRKTLQDKGIL